MLRLKRIDAYILKRFLVLFCMTFLICILILLMQFLWRHVAELVGKGIGWGVLAEFLMYSVVTLVPMALPLAILLASLMTFGNLGENFELTAMKAAGISLFRIIRPLIVFISFVSVGAFFFSNNILPQSQTKLYALVLSLKQKSPEFDIPEGEFYNGIPNVNIYVRKKENSMLKDMMIYDFSGGFDNAMVTLADSGKVQFSKDQKYLLLTLYTGESFANLQRQNISSSANSIPYRRESFKLKEILIDFDSGLNRLSESALKDQHVAKNISQLSHSIDSVTAVADSTSNRLARTVLHQNFLGREETSNVNLNKVKKLEMQKCNADSLFHSFGQREMERVSTIAIDRAKNKQAMIQYNKSMLDEPVRYVMRHEVEWHRKFTLSFACLIFFFIGAPLGAIIRKGGLGAPVVISVIMFIIYYIIDNTGYKMAREGLWTAFRGMWLSSSVLLPVGIYLTYNAAIDAALFNPDQYKKLWTKFKRRLSHRKLLMRQS